MAERRLRIYYTSDLHAHFFPTTYGDRDEKNIGLFKCAAQFEKDGNTLVLDGGDILQGSAFSYYCQKETGNAAAIAKIMNRCGYDAVTIGNHDFNYGFSYLRTYLENLNAPCICQNITNEEGKALYPWRVYTMENGLRIGIAGIVTDFVNVWENPKHLTGIQVTDPFEAARRALSEMRSKCDITLCIYHGGFEQDLDNNALLEKNGENCGCRICRELDFDILLTGHQHRSIPGRFLHGTYIVQPADKGQEYARLDISLAENESGIIITSALCVPGGSFNGTLSAPFVEIEHKVQEWLDQPAGFLPKPLLSESRIRMAMTGSSIADFLNQVQLSVSGAQLSATGLANEITGFPEVVNRRDVLATYPYANTLVVMEVTGAVLRAALERSAEYFELNSGGEPEIARGFLYPKVEHYNYDFFAGIEYQFNITCPKGQRLKKLYYANAPVQDTDVFSLCLNNYRASGAGGYPWYLKCKRLKEINIEMVEILLNYFENNRNIVLNMPFQGAVVFR
ncbi:MAG: bifunctional metallophosphatase/5'-nucleotidase [Treponema sp.]|jgi:2',3'-cyclic-nucleotide 2'-phosphodiesterase/3'-nucleotidase|nr:bifunctional metallophosphatase/5'-nucleotidase [Treponema sp.]